MAVQTKEHIMALLQDHHAHIGSMGIQRLGLFGSFQHGHPTVDSDVDLLVDFIPGYKTFDNFMQLAFFLEALFERPVELVTSESLSPYLSPYILSEVEYVTFDAGVPTTHP
jgi:predicted nucleotidyltransferase